MQRKWKALIHRISASVVLDFCDKGVASDPEKDQDYIIFTLDALIRDAKSRFAYAS